MLTFYHNFIFFTTIKKYGEILNSVKGSFSQFYADITVIPHIYLGISSIWAVVCSEEGLHHH